MSKQFEKIDFPVSKVQEYREPGPIVLVSLSAGDKINIMTMGWHTVMEFAPSLVGGVVSSGNDIFRLVGESGKWGIHLPTTALTREVVGIGNPPYADQRFSLTQGESKEVKPPLIREFHANFKCR